MVAALYDIILEVVVPTSAIYQLLPKHVHPLNPDIQQGKPWVND